MSSRLSLGSRSSALYARRFLLLVLLISGAVPVSAAAEEPAARQSLTAAQRQRFKERDRYSEESTQLQNAGKFSEAVAAAEKMLAIEREVLGNDDWDVAKSLERLAQIQELQPDLAAARKSCEEAVAIATRRGAKTAWQTTDARLALEIVALLEKSSPHQRQQLADADRLGFQIDALIGQRSYRQAIPMALRGLELRRAVLEPSHELLAASYHAIAFLYNSCGQFAEAEPWARKAVEIGRQAHGADHPDYATNLSNLAFCLDGLGNRAEAVALYRQTAEIRQRTLGSAADATRGGWNALVRELDRQAESLIRHGDFAAARAAREEMLHIRAEQNGAASWQVDDARRDLDDLARLEKLDPPKRVELFKADDLTRQVGKLLDAGKYQEALAPAQQALETRRKLLGERHPAYATSLHYLAMTYNELGDYAKALALDEQAVKIEKEVLGDKHPDYAASLNNLAGLYQTTGDYGHAETSYIEAVASVKAAAGEKHVDYATALGNLAFFYHERGNYAKAEPQYQQSIQIVKEIFGEDDPHYALSIGNLAGLYRDKGDYAKAAPLYEQACEIYKAALGERHPHYALSLNNLGKFYATMGDYAKAEPLLLQALQIRKATLGEGHSDYADSLSNLAEFYRLTGEFAKAQPLLEQAARIKKAKLGENSADYADILVGLAMLHEVQGDLATAESQWRVALDIYGRALGERHSHYLLALDGLAALYKRMGDYAKAEPLAQRSARLYKEVLGEKHPHYATSLTNLGKLYFAMNDFIRAEPALLQALQIRKEVFGEKSIDYATSLNELGILYKELRRSDKAELFYQQALAIDKETIGPLHPDYAEVLNNLGVLYMATDNFAKAEPLLQSAVEIKKAKFGAQHSEYALGLENLAALHCSMADYAKAEPLNRQSLQINKAALGEQHPGYILSLYNLGVVYFGLRDYAQAEPLLLDSVRRVRLQLEATAAIQSERQQLQMSHRLRTYLDQYLSLVDEGNLPVDAAYGEVLAWKGAISGRQQAIRRNRKLTEGKSPEAARLFDDLTRTTRELSELSQAVPAPSQQKEHQRRLAELSDRIEQLERSLSGAVREFRQALDERQRTPAAIQKALPADAVLVDFLECDYYVPPKQQGKRPPVERHLVAFVVRPDAPIRRIDLGSAQTIAAFIDLWRKNFGGAKSGQIVDAGAELRRLVWEKLEPHLRDAKLVLLSPDGATARFPWPALPGSKPDSYLIDDLSIVIVPVPRQLPDLLGNSQPGSSPPPPGATSLLLVGDVDFGADPGVIGSLADSRSMPPSDQALNWPSLPGTRAEVAAIEDVFHKRFGQAELREFTQGRATKGAVCDAAKNCQYLHFSTHGFFAPPRLRSALSASTRRDGPAGLELETRQDVSWFHPGLLSGLVLAGANRPRAEGKDGGILTALEVAEMDFSSVQLATLSACETGLGETAGGEGLLGMQRAFQTAGAKSVLASLWKVPDKATQTLMARFYDNLWNKKLTKLESLREAQRWLLRDGAKQPELIRGRGLEFAPDDEQEAKQSGRLSPLYWAAFELSGDWR